MPITQERETIQDLRGVGFTEEQANLLAAKFEAAAQATAQDLKSFIRAENERLRADIEVRFAQMESRFAQMEARFALTESRFAETEARIERSLRVFVVTILTAFLGVTGLAVAIVKLVP
ncbi:MAG: hypothetical protein HY423_14370 [Candidatus Lambdaproteobacteria bacterium]|nr:hypothetical protein [Candidatus Lambdaproteobacteria bacterium]